MAVDSAISLHGAPGNEHKDGLVSTSKRPAIVVNLNAEVVNDLQRCYQHGGAVQLLGGKSPRIRYGSKTLDLNVRPEKFRHEIYATDGDTKSNLAFAALVSYRAKVKATENKAHEDAADEALAVAHLREQLQSMSKEKEARKATITNSVIVTGKNAKHQPRRQPAGLLHPNPPSSSHALSSRSAPTPTSAPSIDPQAKARDMAMRTAIVHLLAVEPLAEEMMHKHTGIPMQQMHAIVSRLADKTSGLWELTNKSFKELDPWKFPYKSAEQREKAIANAIRAFDRIRLDKDDKRWQMLLPEHDRGKGIVLSRLQGSTPNHAALNQHPPQPTALTPNTAPASTPRATATSGRASSNNFSIEKRLKEAKKKQDLEKRKREKEAAAAAAVASDRESKPRTMPAKRTAAKSATTTNSKIKSAEIVHDSDEEDGEVIDIKPSLKSDTPRLASKMPPKARVRPADSSTSEASKASLNPSQAVSRSAPPVKRTVNKPASSTTVKAGVKNPATSKETPAQRPVKEPSLAKNASDKQHQTSPKKDTKPKVPSPLGTSKPRNASEEAEQIAKPKSKPATKPAMSAATATKPAKPTNGASAAGKLSFFGDSGRPSPIIKKRPLEHLDDAKDAPRKQTKLSTTSTVKPPSNDTTKSASSNKATTSNVKAGTNHKRQTTSTSAANLAASGPQNTDKPLKRKANDLSSGIHDHASAPASKHRKADSSSTHSIAATNSSLTSLTTAPTASPSPRSPHSTPPESQRPHSHSLSSVHSTSAAAMDVIQMFLNDTNDGDPDNDMYSSSSPRTRPSWEAALDKAKRFQNQLYPAYEEFYNRLAAMPIEEVTDEERDKLFMMHNKLKSLKKDIYDAVG